MKKSKKESKRVDLKNLVSILMIIRSNLIDKTGKKRILAKNLRRYLIIRLRV